MAYATPRSCKDELHEGMTDGAIRKPRVDRSGPDASPSNTYPGHVMVGLLGTKGSLA
ncbi:MULTISPECIES: hypothetical protein [Streptosporangium]|uniref:Uncharacterized protein n=1 Tax=Streptosporangium brasiliense TaxID=47480 RepID=A0ABT9RM88_9ACTN|nr:hypothetical protein [Streptosporangium brasiliense]MDP9870408.1 hypothetical protein [Streptosporangium brasiliense]